MNCGKCLADKYNFWQRELRKARGGEGTAAPEPICMDGKTIPKTREAELFGVLGIDRVCCKKTLVGHVDMITKL